MGRAKKHQPIMGTNRTNGKPATKQEDEDDAENTEPVFKTPRQLLLDDAWRNLEMKRVETLEKRVAKQAAERKAKEGAGWRGATKDWRPVLEPKIPLSMQPYKA